MLRRNVIATLVASVCTSAALAGNIPGFPLQAPPQNKDLPYTISAHPAGMKALGKDIAIFPTSRYAVAFGYRTRLDPAHPLHGQAIKEDGVLFVPAAFARIILAPSVKADTPPAYLKSRYVYKLKAPAVKVGPSVRRTIHRGNEYLSAVDLADAAGKPYSKGKDGLLVIGEKSPAFLRNPVLVDDVITLFDTPDTLADPAIARKYIPLLKRQGKWTKYVKITPSQLREFQGPQTQWRFTPFSAYDYKGINTDIFGSKVPPPGVYPRLLFSPQDLPALRKRIMSDPLSRYSLEQMKAQLDRSWLNPKTDDGRAFDRLASGRPIKLSELPKSGRNRPVPLTFGLFKGERPSIYWSHIPYIGSCLVGIELYALIENDSTLGHKAARASVTWCQLLERGVDKLNATSDSQFGVDYDKANGAATGYRIMCAADHMSVPFLLDFGGYWMNDKQKQDIQRLLAKMTYGKADSHAAGSMRWEENNHTTWHSTIFLDQMDLEGLEGSDPESWPRAIRTIRAFTKFGIDPKGVVFESNGKNGAGFRFALLNMIAMARRGVNFFGNPHWRNLLEAQVQCTSPNGLTTVSSGTYAGPLFDWQDLLILKSIYPGNRCADWLLTEQFRNLDLSPGHIKTFLEQTGEGKLHNRLPIFVAPLSKRGTLYDTDFKRIHRRDLHLPLTFSSKTYGMFSAFSDDTENATWMNMLVRQNGYLGAGHQHADPGMFYFSGLGINWIEESPHNTIYDGNLHNHVLIDGRSTPDAPDARSFYLGASTKGRVSEAGANLSNSYDWRWVEQVELWDVATWGNRVPLSKQHCEFDPDPAVIAAFKGTQHYKMRPWWPSYTFSNWIPTVRAPFNHVEYAYRHVALIRGKHPYGLVMDDIKKDDKTRHYQWSACLGRGTWLSDYAKTVAPVQPNEVVLGSESPPNSPKFQHTDHHKAPGALAGKSGDPQLLVCALMPHKTDKDEALIRVYARHYTRSLSRNGKALYYDDLVINDHAKSGKFRVLLIPFHRGQPLPKITYDVSSEVATIAWPDKTDSLQFKSHGHQTSVSLMGDEH